MATTVQAAQVVAQGWLDVPWIIWSGVISAAVASGVAAFTTRASNKNSLRLLAAQHVHDDAEADQQRQHDAKQKDEDRKGEIRREVYASAVEESHALLGCIGGLPNRPLSPENDFDYLQPFLKANAKIWLIGNAETAHLSRELAGDFTKTFIHALEIAYPIRQAMEPIHKRREEIVFAEGETRRLNSKLTDAKANNTRQEEQDKLANLVVSAQEYVKELESAQRQAMFDIMPMRMNSFKESFGRIRSLQRRLVKLISALRWELNLPPDEEAFMEQQTNMERQAWDMVNKAYGIDLPGPMPELHEPV